MAAWPVWRPAAGAAAQKLAVGVVAARMLSKEVAVAAQKLAAEVVAARTLSKAVVAAARKLEPEVAAARRAYQEAGAAAARRAYQKAGSRTGRPAPSTAYQAKNSWAVQDESHSTCTARPGWVLVPCMPDTIWFQP